MLETATIGGTHSLGTLIVTTILLALTYLIAQLWYRRYQKHARLGLPQIKTSFLWGHLLVIHEFLVRRGKDNETGRINLPLTLDTCWDPS